MAERVEGRDAGAHQRGDFGGVHVVRESDDRLGAQSHVLSVATVAEHAWAR